MKRSALFDLHQRIGATFIDHQGWQLPAFFVSPEQECRQVQASVGLADLSSSTKFDLKKEPEKRRWKLGAKHYLLLSEHLLDAPPDATDVSSVYTNLRLAGPRSKDVLSKLTSLNIGDAALPNLSCAQAGLAHVHTIFLREDIKEMPAFHLLVSREYSESVWEAIAHAGHEFELCPFGLSALGLLQD